MYLVYSCVPHFMSKELGPCLPRLTSYTSSLASAERDARFDQGFVRNVNQNTDGSWR